MSSPEGLDSAGSSADRSLRLETIAARSGRSIDPQTGAVTLPIHLATTFGREPDGSYPNGFVYGRLANPNRQALERAIADLEGGADAAAFSSGMAAVTAVAQTLRPGDRILVPEDCYHGTIAMLDQVMGPWGLGLVPVAMTDPRAVATALANEPAIQLVWLETPSNPRLDITDLAAIVQAAHAVGVRCLCDNTWATPILQRPIALGVDWVLHSSTKYLSGHSDVTGGVVVAAQADEPFDRLRQIQQLAGAVPSPFDCWLILRSLQTLAVRMAAHCAGARQVAEFLAHHRAIDQVLYPGLASHPGHTIARSQMADFGGMISVLVQGDRSRALAVAGHCQLLTRATSLGGTESLIEHRASLEGPTSRTPDNLLRLSIGLEHPDDLIADLSQALAQV